MYESPVGDVLDVTLPWMKRGCLECEYTAHQQFSAEEIPARCPNDGSVLLTVEGSIVADDIITIARLLTKADHERREGSVLAVAARADLGRVNDIVNRRISELASLAR